MKITLPLFIAFILISTALGLAVEAEFTLIIEPLNIYSPTKQLGLFLNRENLNNIPILIRQENNIAPGDYYRYPKGAKPISLPQTSRTEILSLLENTIKDNYYDSTLLISTRGYSYFLSEDSLVRNEYHLRYSLGDTIYVVSGWLGKFLSFYRAIPGIQKYDYDTLNRKISELAAFDIQVPKEIYEKSSKDAPYFIEFVDRDKMTRVRCYHVTEIISFGQSFEDRTTRQLTLIEVTRFLDKEMMP